VFARPGAGSKVVSLIDPNASVLSFFDVRWGAIEATFSSARSWVSVDAKPLVPPEFLDPVIAAPRLEAYDAQGQLLGKKLYRALYGALAWGSVETLRIDAPGIARVRFSSQHYTGSAAVYGLFDDLRFSNEPL